ncbi:MAG: ATP-binding protein, partial [Rhodospirillales bacterium]|nr:ATP-binding protein [Rhodospirillales bacterium]
QVVVTTRWPGSVSSPDARHWVGIAIREAVANAIKHGNRQDPDKEVEVELASRRPVRRHPRPRPRRRVRSGRGGRSPRAGEPAAPQRARHLLHAQFHGRDRLRRRSRRRHRGHHAQTLDGKRLVVA